MHELNVRVIDFGPDAFEEKTRPDATLPYLRDPLWKLGRAAVEGVTDLIRDYVYDEAVNRCLAGAPPDSHRRAA